VADFRIQACIVERRIGMRQLLAGWGEGLPRGLTRGGGAGRAALGRRLQN
jgi:hypothetical protein